MLHNRGRNLALLRPLGLVRELRDLVARQVQELGLPTRQDLEAVTARLEALESRVGPPAGRGARKPAGTERAARAPATKAAARKPATRARGTGGRTSGGGTS